jgi:hypothetical protein
MYYGATFDYFFKFRVGSQVEVPKKSSGSYPRQSWRYPANSLKVGVVSEISASYRRITFTSRAAHAAAARPRYFGGTRPRGPEWVLPRTPPAIPPVRVSHPVPDPNSRREQKTPHPVWRSTPADSPLRTYRLSLCNSRPLFDRQTDTSARGRTATSAETTRRCSRSATFHPVQILAAETPGRTLHFFRIRLNYTPATARRARTMGLGR